MAAPPARIGKYAPVGPTMIPPPPKHGKAKTTPREPPKPKPSRGERVSDTSRGERVSDTSRGERVSDTKLPAAPGLINR